MGTVPMSPGRIFCLFCPLIHHHEEGDADFDTLFINALRERQIPLEQRLEYPRFLARTDYDDYGRDWTPVERFLSVFDDSLGSVKLLEALLALEGCFAPDDFHGQLLILMPPLERRYNAPEHQTESRIVAGAIEGVLRVCDPIKLVVEEPDILPFVEASWRLLTPRARTSKSADDFFGLPPAEDSDDDLLGNRTCMANFCT
jgi:hypothetical protein